MRPVKLVLVNFMAYGHAEIDFEGVSCAGISGRNMAGKSTLVESIRYALFGRGRYDVGDRTNPDPLVRDGETTMRVELTFAVAGHADHRVIRARNKGNTLLELQVAAYAEGTRQIWSPKTAGTLKDTQRLLERLIGMDDRIWTATGCFLQGEADKFSTMGSTERKKMLQDLLGLDLYPTMQKKASERALAAEKLADQDGRAKHVLEEESLAPAQAMVALIPTRAAAVNSARGALERQKQIVENLRESERGAAQAKEEKSKAAARVDDAREALTLALEDVARRWARKATEEQDAVTKAHRDRMAESESRMNGACRRLHEANEAKKLRAELIAARKKKLEAGPALVALAEDLPGLTEDLERATAAAQKYQEAREQMAMVEATGKAARDTAATLKRPDLNCVDLPRARCAFLAQAKIAEEALPELLEDHARLKAERDELQPLAAQLPDLRKRHQEASQAEKDLPALFDLEGEIYALQTEHDRAEATATEVQAEIEELRGFLKEGESHLHSALEKVSLALGRQEQEERDETVRRHKQAIERAEEEHARTTAFLKEITDDFQLPHRVSRAKADLADAEAALRDAERELGKAEGLASQVETLTARIKVLEGTANEHAQKGWLWRQLAFMLDPRHGIPSEILKTFIPDLENEADRILQRLTGGSMSLRLPTTVEIKAGERERLEIEVRRHGAVRPYEGLSGGGKFRVDFACRVALSKVLARRAGRAVDCLIVDEGFGSQDPDGRERLFEAIEAVQGEFGLILVITHLDELLDRFPTRFEVLDGGPGAGSTVRRTA